MNRLERRYCDTVSTQCRSTRSRRGRVRPVDSDSSPRRVRRPYESRFRPRLRPRPRTGAGVQTWPASAPPATGRGAAYLWRGRRRATSRLSFCAPPNRLSSARTPPPSLWPSSDGVSSSVWRRTLVSATGVAAAAVRREEERRAAGFAGAEARRNLVDVVLDFILPAGDCFCYDTHELPRGCILRWSTRSALGRTRSNGFGF